MNGADGITFIKLFYQNHPCVSVYPTFLYGPQSPQHKTGYCDWPGMSSHHSIFVKYIGSSRVFCEM